MAKGCGNNSVELWYYGKGNVTSATVKTTYSTGTAYQTGSTIVTGIDTEWTAAMAGHTFDFINADGTTTTAGVIVNRNSDLALQVSVAQTVASVGSPLSYVIKDRGTYTLGENVNLSLKDIGVGKGAAFRVNLRPRHTTAGVVNSELDSIDVLSGGLNYDNTQRVLVSHATNTNVVETKSVSPILGGSSKSTTIHGRVEVGTENRSMWHQAKNLQNTNPVVTTDIEYSFNGITHATFTLINNPFDLSSIFSNSDASGQYTDFFREGQEILLRDHTTHIILFRGLIQEINETYEMGLGEVVQISAADKIKEWDDIPAEVFSGTPQKPEGTSGIDLPSAKIYSIIENKIRPYQALKGGERRVAFGEGPLYRLNPSPVGAVFPYDAEGTGAGVNALEGKIAAERGYGHQVGRRFAFENSWFPRDSEHVNVNSLSTTEQELFISERARVNSTTFTKGKQKILSAIQNLAAQEPHGEYRRTSGKYINLDGSESEWAFHFSPNILSPTPETLIGDTTLDGKNDSWITSNPRVFTPVQYDADNNLITGAGKIGISAADVQYGKGFYPSDIGKTITQSGVSGSPAIIVNVKSDNSSLYTLDTIDWVHTSSITLSEGLPSIPQFNYFETGSRPAFSFGTDASETGFLAASEQDVNKHSVTMLAPREPVTEQGINPSRATQAQQSGDRITQPTLNGTGVGTIAVRIDPDNAYSLATPLRWEVRIGAGEEPPTTNAKFQYRYVYLGSDIENGSGWIPEGGQTLPGDSDFVDLRFNIQISFSTNIGHTANDIYGFDTYPQFDNTRAFKLLGPQATFSKYGFEKFSNALVYYDGEASADEEYGSSARLEAELLYGWGVQNRSWVFSTSANVESGTSDYTVRVHHGDASEPHHARPKDGDEDECINFSGSTTAITDIDEFGENGEAFKRVSLVGSLTPFNEKAAWNAIVNDQEDNYAFRDFYWKNTRLTEGAWSLTDLTDFGGATRGGRASEYLDLYRGRYSVGTIDRDDDGGSGNVIPAKLQIEWRRWESGKKIAAVQYVSVPAPYQASPAINVRAAGVHPTSGGGSDLFPFAAGKKQTEMIQLLISFDKGTTGQSTSIGGTLEDSGNWPTTNTYDEKGEPQKTAEWRDFPFVRLVGQTTGTKIDFDAEVGDRSNTPAWVGRPIDTWQALRPLRRTYRKDHNRDDIRLDLATALHKRTADMRVGKFRASKAPYYWLEAQVDGFKESGSNGYGDDDIDPTGESPASNNPNLTKTIRFKLQHLGATTGTKYFNPLQYGIMIGNVVRFYNHNVGGGGVADQNFGDTEEFCYGVITDVQAVTTSPQHFAGSAYQSGLNVIGEVSPTSTAWTADMVGGLFRWADSPTSGEITGFTDAQHIAVTNSQTVGASDDLRPYVINKQNEDTFNMCGWIEVELTHSLRKTAGALGSPAITYKAVIPAIPGFAYTEGNPSNAVVAYTGPTRVRVYNMLYPGYSIFVEDMTKGIAARHVIEGMRFTSRQGILETEYHTSGKKTDFRLRKWGNTPIHIRKSITDAAEKQMDEVIQLSASGVGLNSLSSTESLSTSTYFYINDMGGSPDDVFQSFDGSTVFYV